MSIVFLPRTSQVDAHDIAKAVKRLSVVGGFIAEEDEDDLEDDDRDSGHQPLEDISTTNIDRLESVISTITKQSSFRRSGSVRKPPSKLKRGFKKFQSIYKRYGLRHVSPIIFLVLYSLIGAGIFCAIEKPHEDEMLRAKREEIDTARENTVKQLEEIITDTKMSEETKLYATRDLIIWYEEQLNVHAPSSSITWDMWGALFYVGTIYTTIGYGNIFCSTTGGRVLTIFYAMVGIPLVLAILSDLGTLFCKWINSFWRFVKRRLAKTKVVNTTLRVVKSTNKLGNNSIMTNSNNVDNNVDKPGINSDNLLVKKEETTNKEDEEDYSHVPVSLALFATFAWLFFCSSLFLMWETDWSYFQAVYFFFISLSTIGLGDVVPSRPRLMVTNFGLVIVGLSLVSMCISVLQQNFESWLYRVLQMIKDEYQAALEAGLLANEDDVVDKVIAKQPWYLRKMAPVLMTQSQKKHFAEIVSFKQPLLIDNSTQCTSVTQICTRDACVQAYMAMSEMYSQTEEEEFEISLDDEMGASILTAQPVVTADIAVQTTMDPVAVQQAMPAAAVHQVAPEQMAVPKIPSIFLEDDNLDVTNLTKMSCVSTKDEGVQVTCPSGVGGLTIIEASFATNFVDAIVQTDDSYLKLAKKLEALKVNRAKSLAVWSSPIARKSRPVPILDSTPE